MLFILYKILIFTKKYHFSAYLGVYFNKLEYLNKNLTLNT